MTHVPECNYPIILSSSTSENGQREGIEKGSHSEPTPTHSATVPGSFSAGNAMSVLIAQVKYGNGAGTSDF